MTPEQIAFLRQSGVTEAQINLMQAVVNSMKGSMVPKQIEFLKQNGLTEVQIKMMQVAIEKKEKETAQ
jgi:hypothetical protein